MYVETRPEKKTYALEIPVYPERLLANGWSNGPGHFSTPYEGIVVTDVTRTPGHVHSSRANIVNFGGEEGE